MISASKTFPGSVTPLPGQQQPGRRRACGKRPARERAHRPAEPEARQGTTAVWVPSAQPRSAGPGLASWRGGPAVKSMTQRWSHPWEFLWASCRVTSTCGRCYARIPITWVAIPQERMAHPLS